MTPRALHRIAATVALGTLATVAACRPSAPSSPSESAAQFYTLLDGLGVRGVPDSLALDAVAPYLDSTLLGLLTDARHTRDDFRRRYPSDKPPFVDGDMFSSLFEGNTSFAIRSRHAGCRAARQPRTHEPAICYCGSPVWRKLGFCQSR